MKKVSFGTLLAIMCLFSLQGNSQTADTFVQRAIQQEMESEQLHREDGNWVITDVTTSTKSGVQHIYYRQLVNGIEVYGSESGVHIKDGVTISKNNRFIANANNKAVSGNNPSMTAVQAVQAAANHFGYALRGSISVIESSNDLSRQTLMSSEISRSEIPAELVYQLNSNNELVLSWDLSIEAVDTPDWWSVRVDANSGQIVDQDNWTVSCNLEHNHAEHDAHQEETLDYNRNLYNIANYEAINAGGDAYEVFALPLESPYFGSRSIISDPADATASPFGWHDTDGSAGAEFTITRGNNVYAYEDGDNQGFSPDGGAGLNFTGYPFDQNYSNANQYESAAITNLFYWNNIIHDLLFYYGFDEESGNFQELNYSGLGAGSDSVNAEAQDGSGTCNANMSSPPDGQNGRMQMYVCGDKDGDFDNLVIIHEYGHGVSIRLTGGPNTNCLGGNEQMGEGWSDFLGVIMTMEPGAMAEDPRPVGTYLFDQGPNGGGIRPFPYSTDLAVNPQTYDDIKTAAIPHGVGSVWSTMLWELTWALIDEHGIDNDLYNFTGDVNQDAGNVQALALVMEGLKLQPCNPGFVDGRDAIFAADQALYGGANECIIWDAFAKRGLGLSADQGSSGSASDGTEAFDTPSGVAEFTAPNDVCEGSQVLTGLSGGTPFGGVYSGPGVTDDGNGSTYTFDPAVAGVGVHTITYSVDNGNCSIESDDSDDIEVIGVDAGPTTTDDTIACSGDEATVMATPNDPNNVIFWYDAMAGGTKLAEGESYTFNPNTDVTVYAQERPAGPSSKLVISELNFEFPDRIEIQNVGDAFDYTGYTLAVSEEPYSDINTINPITQSLGNMGADSVLDWTDESGNSNYWGSNIWWGGGSNGWAIIIDDNGNVVDSVFWNLTEAEIATLNVTINGFTVTGADVEFIGDGASLDNACNTASSFRRKGDTDSADDFTDSCESADFGTPNSDIGDVSGFLGCLSLRSAATVTVSDDVAPSLDNCPGDQAEEVSQGEQFTLPDYTTGVTSTDNCTATPTISQDPAAGTQVGVGVTEITITSVDDAGNDISCTFELTVTEEVLSVNDNELAIGIVLFPNPTNGTITLSNNTTQNLTSIVFTDVNGRTINTIDLSGADSETTLSLESFAAGLYFAQINSESGTTVKRIVKK